MKMKILSTILLFFVMCSACHHHRHHHKKIKSHHEEHHHYPQVDSTTKSFTIEQDIELNLKEVPQRVTGR